MSFFAIVLALLAPLQATRPAQIILFRHAEKADKANPHLSPEGVQRARKLVGFLPQLAAELGAPPPPPWKGKEYDQVYVISWRGRAAELKVMKENLGPP